MSRDEFIKYESNFLVTDPKDRKEFSKYILEKLLTRISDDEEISGFYFSVFYGKTAETVTQGMVDARLIITSLKKLGLYR